MCHCVWLARLLGELDRKEAEAVGLRVDNKATIALSKNPVFHDRSKHIDTRFHYIRDLVKDGSVEVDHIATEEQLADILTKGLGRARFQELRAKIGVAVLK